MGSLAATAFLIRFGAEVDAPRITGRAENPPAFAVGGGAASGGAAVHDVPLGRRRAKNPRSCNCSGQVLADPERTGDTVTEFEQAVAEALWQRVPAVSGPGPSLEEIVKEWLAPRVAAAIEAAGRFNPYDKNRAGVLAALRGASQHRTERP